VEPITATLDSESRRLAAILAADIAGYSALMGADEARTVRDLKGHLAVVFPMVSEFGGRIVHTAGDGILAEFASVVNAVKCAVAIQSTMAERNAAIEPEPRMQFRIGINIGDIVYNGMHAAIARAGLYVRPVVHPARQSWASDWSNRASSACLRRSPELE
jgi:class 3 adenylate cyclase